MYTPTGSEKVIELASLPPPDVGAPLPLIVADERLVLIGYVLPDHLTEWPGLAHATLSSDGLGELYAIAKFTATCHYFGPPNDEAFEAHPLAAVGLTPYSCSEVVSSPWIAALERANSVHPDHDPAGFQKLRHFILAFHDSTFECVASAVTVSFTRGTVAEVVAEMARVLD